MNALYLTSLVDLTLGVIILLLGLIILKENARQRLNRITGVMMLFAATGPLLAACGLLLQLGGTAAADLLPYRRFALIWEFFFPQLLLFSWVFPRELPWARRRPGLVLLLFLPHLIHFMVVWAFSGPESVRAVLTPDALGHEGWIQPLVLLARLGVSTLEGLLRHDNDLFAVINLLYIVAAITFMMLGQRRIVNDRARRQVGLVLWGIRTSVGLYVIASILPRLRLITPDPTVTALLTVMALFIGAGSIGWAMVRYQFLNIRFMIRRGLIVSLTFGILIGLYLLVYSQGKRLVTAVLGVEVPILEVLFIIVSLLGFEPALSAIEKLVERFFMRDKADHRNVLRDLTQEIMTTLDLDLLRVKLTATLEKALSLEKVGLLLPESRGLLTEGKGDASLHIRPRAETRALLVEAAAPMGFEELALRAGDDPAVAALREFAPHWVIPLVYRGQLNGLLLLGEKVIHTVFSSEDMTVLAVLANQAAIAVENARLYRVALEKRIMEEELGFAREIQRHLLPNQGLDEDDLELRGYNLPSTEVGGDYYDFVPLDGGRLGIAIGDISGKGVPAAILMSNLQAALRLCARRHETTNEVVSRVNVHITQTTTADRFATFFYGVLDRKHRRLEYTNAGHNYPVLLRRGQPPRLLKDSDIIIGVKADFPYASHRVSLEPGDVVVLYTDGVTEAKAPDGTLYAEERLLESLARVDHRSAQGVLDHILESLCDFTHGELQSDDLTLVVMKVK